MMWHKLPGFAVERLFTMTRRVPVRGGPYSKCVDARIAQGLLATWITILGSSIVGCGIPLACAPCALRNDPRENALDEVWSWAGRTGETDSCRINAMQHCIAAAVLADDCGSRCAVWAGEILEILQGDGDPMDKHNNEQGSQCNGSMDNIAIRCCEDMLDAGGLRTDGSCD